MRRWTQLTLAMVAAAGLTIGCAGDDGRQTENEGKGTGTAVGTTGTANAPDQDFVRDQLEDGEAEVMLGRLAAQKARNPQVKEFAQMMVQDHQKAGAELKQAVGQQALNEQNANQRRERDDEHQELQERLSKLSGAEFDREYMDAMVKEHEEAVNELEGPAENADNAQIKQWASKTLQHVQHHLERAKQIQQTLEQSGNNENARPRDRGDR